MSIGERVEDLSVMAMSMPVGLGEATLQFDRPGLAVAGAVLAVTGVAYGIRQGRVRNNQAEIEAARYPDPDMAATARSEYRKEGRLVTAVGVLAGVAAGAAAANMAGPTLLETVYRAGRVSIIVDASADGRANDVTDSKTNMPATRIEAGLNSGLRFADDLGDGVDVQFIFGGSPARSLGNEERGSDNKGAIVSAAGNYAKDLSTAGSSPDITGALAIAASFGAEQTILITSNPDVATADAIAAHPHGLDIISPGKAGTVYRFLGEDRKAGYTATFGQKEATGVDNTDDMQKAMDVIIDNKVKTTTEEPSRFYETLRNLSVAALGVLTLRKLKPLRRRT